MSIFTTFTRCIFLLLSITPITTAIPPRFPPNAYFNPQRANMCVSTPHMVRWVYRNHFRQLNACSVPGLKRERTPDTQLFFGPSVIRGEADVDATFANFCKSRADGGLKGLKFREVHSFIVGNVANVKWIADAPFLKEPYPGSDAYVTCGYRMLAIVSSFDGAELKFKD